MEILEKKLGYTFRDPSLLRAALYHSSYANEHRAAGIRSNERLEFLGDAVLGFVTAEYLYAKHSWSWRGNIIAPSTRFPYSARSLSTCFSWISRCRN